jgi:hypothetical protein
LNSRAVLSAKLALNKLVTVNSLLMSGKIAYICQKRKIRDFDMVDRGECGLIREDSLLELRSSKSDPW